MENTIPVNREAWLQRAVELLRPRFTAAGYTVPDTVHVSVGFPSKGSLSRKIQRIGECWMPKVSADGNTQIFISPIIADGVKVLGVLLHELIHAALPDAGHKAPFAKAARVLGLEGPPKATTEPEGMRSEFALIIERELGTYPHPALNPTLLAEKVQTTRMLKVVCNGDACKDEKGKPYTLRLTKSWLDREGFGAPLCPNCETVMVSPDETGDSE